MPTVPYLFGCSVVHPLGVLWCTPRVPECTPVDNLVDHEITVGSVVSILSNNQHFTHRFKVFDDALGVSAFQPGNVGDALDARP